MSSFVADFLRTGRSKIVIIAASLASASITARELGPDGSGVVAGLLAIPSLVMSLGSMGVRQSSAFMLGARQANEAELRNSIFWLWVVSSLVGAAAAYFAIRHISNVTTEGLRILAVAAVPFSLYASYLSGIYLGRNRIVEVNRVDWIPPVVTLIGNLIFVVILNLSIAGALLAHLLGPFSVFVILVARNPLPRFSAPKLSLVSRLLRLGALYATALFIINLNYRIDLVLLEKLSTPEQLGWYSKGANVAQYLWQIPMFLSLIVFARGVVAEDPKRYSFKVARLLRVSLLAILVGSIALFVIAPWVTRLLYGREFDPSALVVRLLLPGVVILTVFKVMNMDLASKGLPWIAVRAMLPALAVNIAINVYLIPRYGAVGAAIASTVSYAVGGMLFAVAYSRCVGISIGELLLLKREDLSYLRSKLGAR